MFSQVEELLLERLKYYKEGLHIKNRMKSYPKLLEAVGRLKEKYAKAARLYDITVVPQRQEGIPTMMTADIKWEKKDPHHKDATMTQGTYVLQTNYGKLDNKQIIQTYRLLSSIEKSFCDMKSHLGFRPNFHQLEKRVNAHMFLSVLAYHVHAIECKLKKAGEP